MVIAGSSFQKQESHKITKEVDSIEQSWIWWWQGSDSCGGLRIVRQWWERVMGGSGLKANPTEGNFSSFPKTRNKCV